MALERTGLSSVLTFDEKSAVTSMGKATSAFNGLNSAANKGSATVMVSAEKLRAMSQTSQLLGGNLGKTSRGLTAVAGAARKMGSVVSRAGVALSNMGRSLGFAALATAPFAAGLAHGASQWAKFEDAMADIKSADPFNVKGLEQAREESLRLGRTTKFSSVDVASSMAGMRKAGMELNDVIATMGATTTLAAAGDSNLATASKLLSKLLAQTGTEADNAQSLIDKIAVASAGSTATLPEMAQALSYVGGTAHDLGVNIEQTLAAIGAIGAAGKEGSRAGRGLDIALSDLIKGYTKLGQPLRVTKDGELDLIDTTKLLNMELDKQVAKLPKHKREMSRNAMINKQFSQNSARAFRALSNRMQDIEKMYGKLRTGTDSYAQAMANVQLDTPIGQFTRLKNAMDTLSIQFFGMALKSVQPEITRFADFVGGVGATLAFLNLKEDDTTEAAAKTRKEFSLASPAAKAFGKGLKMAADSISDTIRNIEAALESLKLKLDRVFGPEGTNQIVSWASQFAVAMGVLSPFLAVSSILLITMGSFVSAIGAMIGALGGLEAAGAFLMSGLLMPFLTVLGYLAVALGVVALVFAAYRNENESVIDTMMRFWNDVVTPFIDGFMNGLAPAITLVGQIFEVFGGIVLDTLGYVADAFKPLTDEIFGTSTDMKNLGTVFGQVVGFISIGLSLLVGGVTFLVSAFVTGVAKIAKVLISGLVDTIKLVVFNISELVSAWEKMFNGDMVEGIKQMGQTLLSTLITPFSQFIKVLFTAAEKVLNIKIPDSIKRFVEAPEVTQKPPPTAPGAAAAKAGAEAENQKTFGERNKQALQDIFGQEKEKTVKVQLNLENRTIREVTAKFEKELSERAAEKGNAWQRRMQAEQASVSVK